MNARTGDEIVVDSHEGGPRREGEIIDIRTVGGVIDYVVRWDDGHETVFIPGNDARVVRPGRTRN